MYVVITRYTHSNAIVPILYSKATVPVGPIGRGGTSTPHSVLVGPAGPVGPLAPVNDVSPAGPVGPRILPMTSHANP